MAQASLAELDTQLELACRLDYLTDAELGTTNEQVLSLGRQMYALRNALLKRLTT
jgi:four helix bundle protein